jgi:hypothetical protein
MRFTDGGIRLRAQEEISTVGAKSFRSGSSGEEVPVGGYQVRTERIKVGVGDYLNNNVGIVDAVVSNLGNLTMAAPEAGQSVGPELKAVTSAWDEALPKVKKELQLIADSVNDSAKMYEEVEVQGSRPFAQFAS